MKRHSAVAVIASFALLAGCAAGPEPMSAKASESLTKGVVAVATHASDGKLKRAVAALDAVQERLDASVKNGSVSDEKAESIQAAINAVRADLEVLVAKAEAKAAAEKAAEAEKAAQEKAAQEKAAQEKAAAEEAAREAAKPKPGKGKGKKKP